MVKRRVEVVPAVLRDASFVVANMRPADEVEVLCQLQEGVKRHEIAYALLMSGDAFVTKLDGKPVLFFGTNMINICTLNAWAVGTKETWRVLVPTTRFLIQEYLPKQVAKGIHTMEARTHVDHEHSHRWLESTGAVVNGTPFVYGRNREKFLLYRWEAEVLAQAAARYKVNHDPVD